MYGGGDESCCHEGGLVGVQAREFKLQPRLIVVRRRPTQSEGRSADNISIHARTHQRAH